MKPSPVLLRACGRGNQAACDIARRIKIMYAASVLSFSDVDLKKDNDNKLPFTGTLLFTDVASEKPPHGSEGHRIYVSKQSAMEALEGIVGQAVNYQPDGLNAHASRHKVGVITRAWMEGNKVKVSGFIWIKDFPEARVLKNRSDLGMSMELSSVYVEDEDSDVWVLKKFDFTGATILMKKAAAYTKTDLAAVAAAAKGTRGEYMPKHTKERKVAAAHKKDTGQDTNLALMTQAISGSLATAVQNAFSPVIAEMKASSQAVMEGLEELKGLHLIQAAAAGNGGEDDDEIVLNAAEDDASASASDAMEAAGRRGAQDDATDDDGDDDDATESDMEASASGSASASASDEEMEAMEDLSLEDADQEPGEVNKDASSHGSKTSVTKPPKQGEHFSGNIAKGRLHSSADRKVKTQGTTMKKTPTTTTIQAATFIGELQASVKGLRRQMKAQAAQHEQVVGKLRKKLSRVTAQMEHFASLEGRRSRMSHELVALGEKVGVDFNETRDNGQKYSTRAFDSILAAADQVGLVLSPQQRIAMKMIAAQEGILDEGVVDRGYGRA